MAIQLPLDEITSVLLQGSGSGAGSGWSSVRKGSFRLDHAEVDERTPFSGVWFEFYGAGGGAPVRYVGPVESILAYEFTDPNHVEPPLEVFTLGNV